MLLGIIVYSNAKGTVTINIPDGTSDSVKVHIYDDQGLVEVLDKDDNWSVKIDSRKYTVELNGGDDQIKLVQQELSVTRFGHPVPRPDYQYERRTAEWLLSLGGKVTVEAKGSEQRFLKSVEELPNDDFELTGVFLPHAGLPGSKGLRDEDFKRLSRLSYLTDLASQNLPNITSQAYSHLSEMSTLQSIDVFGIGDGDNVLKHLQKSSLRTFKGRGITDLGLNLISRHGQVDFLYLYVNHESANYTAAGLGHLSTLEELNQLALDGAGNGESEISTEFLVSLSRIPNLKSLSLSSFQYQSGCEAGMKQLSSLIQLTIHNTTDLRPELLSAITELKDLRSIRFKDCSLSDRDLEFCSTMALEYLWLIDNPKITDEGLPRLKTLTSLFERDVTGTKVTEAALLELIKSMPKCTIHWDGGTIEPEKRVDDSEGQRPGSPKPQLP